MSEGTRMCTSFDEFDVHKSLCPVVKGITNALHGQPDKDGVTYDGAYTLSMEGLDPIQLPVTALFSDGISDDPKEVREILEKYVRENTDNKNIELWWYKNAETEEIHLSYATQLPPKDKRSFAEVTRTKSKSPTDIQYNFNGEDNDIQSR